MANEESSNVWHLRETTGTGKLAARTRLARLVQSEDLKGLVWNGQSCNVQWTELLQEAIAEYELEDRRRGDSGGLSTSNGWQSGGVIYAAVSAVCSC